MTSPYFSLHYFSDVHTLLYPHTISPFLLFPFFFFFFFSLSLSLYLYLFRGAELSSSDLTNSNHRHNMPSATGVAHSCSSPETPSTSHIPSSSSPTGIATNDYEGNENGKLIAADEQPHHTSSNEQASSSTPPLRIPTTSAVQVARAAHIHINQIAQVRVGSAAHLSIA